MKSLILGILLFIFCASGAEAAFDQSSCTHPLGYQQLTSLSVSTGVASVPAGTIYMILSVETSPIRWRDDGIAPTASIGMPVSAGSSLSYTGKFSAIRFIQQSAGAIVDAYFCGP